MYEPAQKYEEKCYFNRNKTLNFFVAFKMAYFVVST